MEENNNIQIQVERVVDEALARLAEANRELVIERALRGQLQEEITKLKEEINELRALKE